MTSQQIMVGVLVVFGTFAAWGCSSSTTDSPGTQVATTDGGSEAAAPTNQDAATATDGATDSATTAPCPSTLTNAAPEIDEMNVAAVKPTPAGGTYMDGTYFLTARSEYTGVGGQSGPRGHKRKETLRVAGNVIELVKARDGSANAAITANVSAAGTTLTLADACAAGAAATFDFDATSTTITLYEAPPNEAKVSTFTRQP